MYTLTYDTARRAFADDARADRDAFAAEIVAQYRQWAARVATEAAAAGTLDEDLAFLADVAGRDPVAFGAALDALADEDLAGAALDDSYVGQTTALVWHLVCADAEVALSDAAIVVTLLT